MKVLQLANNFHLTPLYAHLFRALNQLGVEQDIYCGAKQRSAGEDKPPWVTGLSVRISHLVNRSDKIFFRSKIKKLARDVDSVFSVADYDLIHAHTLYSDGALAALLSEKYGVPYVVAFRNTDINYFRKLRPDLRCLERRIVSGASRVISISGAYSRRFGGSFSKRPVTIPNGIDDFWFDADSFRGQLDQRAEGVVQILSVSDLSKNKNVERLIDAVVIARSKARVDYRLTLVGGTEARAKYYSEYVRGRNLSFVRVIGRVNNQVTLKRIYSEHQIFALPSHYETFGLVFIEALSQGLPIICTEGQGIDGSFESQVVSKSVNSRNASDIAHGILSLSSSCCDIRGICMQEARRFRWREIAQQYLSEYSAVLS